LNKGKYEYFRIKVLLEAKEHSGKDNWIEGCRLKGTNSGLRLYILLY